MSMQTVLFFPGCSSQKLSIVPLIMGESWVIMRTEERDFYIFFNWWQISTFIYCIFHATRQHAVTPKETFHPISYSQQVEQAYRRQTGPIQRRVENNHLRKDPSQVSRGCLTGEGREEIDIIGFSQTIGFFLQPFYVANMASFWNFKANHS